MVQGKWFAPGTNPGAAADVRQEVFGFGQDALDSMSWNVLVYQDDVPAASGRIWWEDGAYRLGEIGVLPALRGRRLGDLTFRLLLFKAQEHFAREVRLAAPPEVLGFFTRLGFRPDPLSPHAEGALVEMVLPGAQIDLDSCKNCDRVNCPSRKPD